MIPLDLDRGGIGWRSRKPHQPIPGGAVAGVPVIPPAIPDQPEYPGAVVIDENGNPKPEQDLDEQQQPEDDENDDNMKRKRYQKNQRWVQKAVNGAGEFMEKASGMVRNVFLRSGGGSGVTGDGGGNGNVPREAVVEGTGDNAVN
ncbi:hypothetical protein HDU76_003907 [Blyttiomyces sp. JEL0837]|nr:hypothetical protein HDU76_003907 [Blyttiomyces sp. JEL0837]